MMGWTGKGGAHLPVIQEGSCWQAAKPMAIERHYSSALVLASKIPPQ
jgi:hypothetical protein